MLRADLGWLCAGETKLWTKVTQRGTQVSAKKRCYSQAGEVGRSWSSFVKNVLPARDDTVWWPCLFTFVNFWSSISLEILARVVFICLCCGWKCMQCLQTCVTICKQGWEPKNTASSLKNSTQGFSNCIKTYWFIGYTIAEYCEAHGAWGMMNFRADFIASPGTLKIKWPLYPIQLWHALVSDKYCWLNVTSKDYCYACDVLSYFQEPLRALFLVSKTSPLLNLKLTGNLTDINVLQEKEFPPFCLRMLLSQ